MINLPASFEKRMKMILGTEFPEFLDSLSSSVSHSIRINPGKITKAPLLSSVPYCSTGYYSPERPIYTLDPLFHNGSYYVQESSSMFLGQFMMQSNRKNLRVLDLCASPGGKSTHLSSLLTEDSLLISNDVIHSRALILSENLKKWGNPNVIVTCNDPRDFSRMPGYFDVIIVDAPCSGEGLFRKDGAAMEEWSESNADHCSQRQKRILADIWPSLAEGGMLIYSTCTYNPAENEENIAWLSGIAEIQPVTLQFPSSWGITTTDANGFPCYRFYPHKVKGEGFFIAGVIKKGNELVRRPSKGKPALSAASKAEQSILKDFLKKETLAMLKFESDILAWPSLLLSDLDLVKSSLRIVHAGVKVGEIIRDSFIPSHELAVSVICNISHFPSIDLTLEQAISFLKRDDFHLTFTEKNWNIITYKGQPTGWAKNLGNRFNNGYPKEWRIRMSTTAYTGEKLLEESRKFPLEQ